VNKPIKGLALGLRMFIVARPFYLPSCWNAGQKKSGLVIHLPGNPAEPERIVKALCGNFSQVPLSCFD
jgi:hypothetical protein